MKLFLVWNRISICNHLMLNRISWSIFSINFIFLHTMYYSLYNIIINHYYYLYILNTHVVNVGAWSRKTINGHSSSSNPQKNASESRTGIDIQKVTGSEVFGIQKVFSEDLSFRRASIYRPLLLLLSTVLEIQVQV